MDFWVGVSGAWKKVTGPHVGVSSSHKAWTAAWIGVGGVWKKFYEKLQLSPSTASVGRVASPGPCYATLRFSNTGEEFSNIDSTSPTTNSSRGDWLDVGDAADVWVERTVITGAALNHTDEGFGRKQLNVDREYGLVAFSGSLSNTTRFDFYDAASGGNLLDSVDIPFNVTVL